MNGRAAAAEGDKGRKSLNNQFQQRQYREEEYEQRR